MARSNTSRSNSSIACPYDSRELAAASEFRTAFFGCSKSGSRSIVLALARLVVQTVIPAHYFLTGLTTEVSGRESADEWVNDQEKVHHADVRRLDSANLTLNAAELKGSHHRIYYFGNHFEKK